MEAWAEELRSREPLIPPPAPETGKGQWPAQAEASQSWGGAPPSPEMGTKGVADMWREESALQTVACIVVLLSQLAGPLGDSSGSGISPTLLRTTGPGASPADSGMGTE